MTSLFWTSILLVMYTYFVYPGLLFFLRMLMKRSPIPDSQFQPRVTIVISVYNEEHWLRERLINLMELDYPPEKIGFLVGSDGATDGTNDILLSSGLPNMTVRCFSTRRGKAQVLNDLVSEASGEIIVFSDANTRFDRDVVSRLVGNFGDPTVGAVCGSLVLESNSRTAGGLGEGIYWKYENLLKNLESQIWSTVGATGGIYAIRSSLFKPLPADRAVPDDLVLPANVLKQGYRVVYEPKAIAYEILSNSVSQEFQRRVRIGTSDFHSLVELRELLNPRAGFVSFALWSRKVIRWFAPLLLVTVFLTSITLISDSTFFALAFWGQVAFYAAALIGYVLERAGAGLGFLGIPYYFSAMNLALLIGLYRFLRGKQPFTWDIVR